jgi:hypothetical protein
MRPTRWWPRSVGYVVQSIAGHDELLGPDVTLANLLLKNTVTNSLVARAYALLTDAATAYLGIPLDGSIRHVEHYDHYPPIESNVFAL